jgi:hypothetical protein
LERPMAQIATFAVKTFDVLVVALIFAGLS